MLKIAEEEAEESDSKSNSNGASSWSQKMMVEQTVRRRKSGDLRTKIEATKDVRKLVRKSSSSNSKSAVRDCFAIAGAIEPLVSMLHSSLPVAAGEAALLALLNFAALNQSEVLCFGKDMHRVVSVILERICSRILERIAPEFWRGFSQGCVCHFVDYSVLTTS